MALVTGSVSVSAGGTVSGSDATLRLYTKLATVFGAKFPGGIPSGPAGKAVKQGLADLATAIASWYVEETTGHAEAKIRTTDSGLQAVPASTAHGTPTDGPAMDKFIPIV